VRDEHGARAAARDRAHELEQELDLGVGHEHGRLVEEQHGVLEVLALPVALELLGGPHDRPERLGDRRERSTVSDGSTSRL